MAQVAFRVLPRPADDLLCRLDLQHGILMYGTTLLQRFLPHVPPVIFMSLSSSVVGGGSQKLDGQWLEEIASYCPTGLLLTPRLGIAPTGGRRKGCQDLWVSLRQLCLLGDECQGQTKQRLAPISEPIRSVR